MLSPKEADMERLTIGEVAKQAHVRIETLRYYERTGLVASPPRSESNYRLYPPETVRRVQFIKRAGSVLKVEMTILDRQSKGISIDE